MKPGQTDPRGPTRSVASSREASLPAVRGLGGGSRLITGDPPDAVRFNHSETAALIVSLVSLVPCSSASAASALARLLSQRLPAAELELHQERVAAGARDGRAPCGPPDPRPPAHRHRPPHLEGRPPGGDQTTARALVDRGEDGRVRAPVPRPNRRPSQRPSTISARRIGRTNDGQSASGCDTREPRWRSGFQRWAPWDSNPQPTG
jgi:hypothetical protein